MPSLLPLQRFHSRCPTCGVGYHIGYSYSHHVKWCSRNKDPPAAGGPCHSDERDYEHEHNDPACSVESADEGAIAVSTDGREVCRPDEEIVRYFADDVDRPGLLQCANWGAKELSPQQKETFRFLQVVDAGDGTSGRVAQGVLNYARRLGGDGLLLPRSIKRCWQILDQVPYYTLSNSQFKFELQILQFKFRLHLTILNFLPMWPNNFYDLVACVPTGPRRGIRRHAESDVCLYRATRNTGPDDPPSRLRGFHFYGPGRRPATALAVESHGRGRPEPSLFPRTR